MHRRNFLQRLLGSGAALLGPVASPRADARAEQAGGLWLPRPGESGVDHIVVVMMENRSFDHLLGWLPNADGRQEGLSYVDSNGVAQQTAPLAPDFTGLGHADPDHSYQGGRVQYNGGELDGFARSSSNDGYALGYYVESDRPFFSALARHYTTLDRYYCSILGPTFPNRLFLHAAQTDRLDDSITLTGLPTIWDRLAAAGVTGRYYYSNVPFLALWGARYAAMAGPYQQFLADAAAGALPAVSFVDPRFTLGEDDGNDDHPHADIRAGDDFLAQTFLAVASGPAWPGTVFVVTYDEWGGFFDHAAPPRAAAPNNADPDLLNGRARLGFRVPAVIASPFSRGQPSDPRVRGMVCDHASILKLIEWRWDLPPLTARDASGDIQNLALALDFRNSDAGLPEFNRPPALSRRRPTGAGKTNAGMSALQALKSAPEPATGWPGLLSSALINGWPLPD